MAFIIPKKTWRYPLAIEREYAKDLAAYVRKQSKIIESFVPEMTDALWKNRIRADKERQDAFGDWLNKLVDKIGGAIKKYVGNERGGNVTAVTKTALKTFAKVNNFNKRQFGEIMESVFGTAAQEKPKSRNLEMTKTIWVSQNTTLIKSVDSEIMDKVRYTLSQKIIDAADKKILQEELIRDIRTLTGVSEKRAALIGADQVGKLNGMLTRYRQQSAGIERYIWVTRGDDRVRLAHKSRHGVSYRWDSPPPGGHPGEAIRCRCVAQPLIDEQSFRLTPKPGSFTTPINGGTIAINIEGVGEAQMPVNKIFSYALDPNGKGRDKAIAFKEALGYDKSNGWHLVENVSQHINEYNLKPNGKNQHGERFEVVLNLKGVNEKIAAVLTGWLKDKENNIFRLTTIHVDKKRGLKNEN